jgi:glycoprotein 2-beta-D-xylosyltransferase
VQDNVSVLFIRRVHYLAHPRHSGQIVRRLDNEDEIYAAIERKASEKGSQIALTNGLFSSMSMAQQVQAIQDACIIMGAHGAGLSHVLLAPAGAHVFELRPPSFMRPHFISYAYWAGVFHHDWPLGTSVPSPSDVLDRLTALIAEVKVH